MSARTVRVISWMVFSLAVVLSLGQIYLSVLNRAVDVPGAAGVVLSELPGTAVGLGLVALGLLVGIVVLLQRTFVLLTGEGSQLTIVASTLAIAALFNPFRRRIQGFVDRRFYRGKYDARKTLATFSAGLRDESDLDNLTENLVGVVRETVKPAHVSLWLAPWEGQVER